MKKRKLTPAQIKQHEVQMLLAFEQFCREQKIQWSLSGGSLLGAIRHKGFIPWDDDIDLCLSRPNYDYLVRNFRHPYLKLVSYETGDFLFPFARIIDETTEIEALYSEKMNKHLWLDIFPVDGLPKEKNLIKKVYSKCNFYRRILMLIDSRLGTGRTTLHKYSKYILKPLSHLYGSKRCVKKIVDIAHRIPYEEAEYVGAITWGLYGVGECMLKSDFENYVEVEFEGYKFPAVSCWDGYLKGLYGNYMELPPENKRQSHEMTVYTIFDNIE